MTRDMINSLLDKWIKILGLSDWRIQISYEDCEDKYSHMEIIRSQDYQQAKIIVPRWWLDEEAMPEEIRFVSSIHDENVFEESFVHELLHLFVTPLGVIVRVDLETFLHRDVHSQIEKAFNRAEERTVDNLAVALCRAFREKEINDEKTR